MSFFPVNASHLVGFFVVQSATSFSSISMQFLAHFFFLLLLCLLRSVGVVVVVVSWLFNFIVTVNLFMCAAAVELWDVLQQLNIPNKIWFFNILRRIRSLSEYIYYTSLDASHSIGLEIEEFNQETMLLLRFGWPVWVDNNKALSKFINEIKRVKMSNVWI